MPASRSAITLPAREAALGAALPDPAFEGWDVNSVAGSAAAQHTTSTPRSHNYTARPEDITLQRYLGQADEERFAAWGTGDFFDPDASVDLNLVAGEAGLQRRDSEGREVDANGDPIDDLDTSSIGVAREAPQAAGRPSLNIGDMSGLDSFGADDFAFGEAGTEGGLDLGLEEFEAERQRSTTPAATQAMGSFMQDLTPRTALKVQQAAEKRAATAIGEKTRKQVVDSQIELLDTPSRQSQANRASTAAILAEERYLPRSKAYMQLLDLHNNPTRHLLPFSTSLSAGKQTTYMASKGLAPQLSDLFTFDASHIRRRRSPSMEERDVDRPEKRLRTDSMLGDETGDITSEVGRRLERESGVELEGLRPELSFDDFGGGDGDAAFDLPAMEVDASEAELGPRRSQRKRVTGDEVGEKRNAFDERGNLPRLATPSVAAEGETLSSVQDSPSSSNLLAAFDRKATFEGASLAAETHASAQAGMSKSTARAVKILRRQLQSSDDDDDGEAGQVSFQKLTTNATRRAAAGFFLELLVLGTKDCINVEQTESFGDISIRAKHNLWAQELQTN